MKRGRIDEHPKSETSTRADISHINNTLSGFPRVQITHPTSGTAIVSPYQGPTEVGKVDGGMQSSVHIPIQNFTAMPAAATAQTPITQGLQGSSPSLASLHSITRVDQPAVKPRVPTAAVSPSPSSVATLSQVATTGTNQQFQRLKVEDALSYLDQVKFKFGSQPQVYNNFLDIMKEFKSQSIDTPGVIERVSTLFRGHPELIVGFNTFLPPGYKIEVQNVDGQGAVTPSGTQTQTVVHTPTGILTHNATAHIPPMSTAGATPTSQTHLLTQQQPPKQTMHAFTANVTQAAVSLNAGQHSYHQPTPIPTSTSPRPGAPSPHSNPTPLPTAANPQSQPVEFNHAINYVNKIKNRFQGQPDVYKQFLEILHTYQKEQRVIKETGQGASPVHSQPPDGSGHPKSLSEAEVYSQVARLFQNQTDLLQEFGQFLPDATNAANGNTFFFNLQPAKLMGNDHTTAVKKPVSLKLSMQPFNNNNNNNNNNKMNNSLKRPPPTPPPVPPPTTTTTTPTITSPASSHPPAKKPKMGTLKDVTLAEAGKYGTLNEFAFFDKVRKALKGGSVYENFLRCLQLYNQEVVSRTDVVQLVSPFLVKFPELMKWFKDFVGYRDGTKPDPVVTEAELPLATSTPPQGPPPIATPIELVTNNIVKQGRVTGDLAMEIDYSTCKRLGASYCALPKSYSQPKCSGRTALCKEVLNDTWVSFPSWSEDSTFVSSRKTQYEEYIYRCEDERFELDVVIELNAATIKILDSAQKKIVRMAPEDASKFRLDDSFGGSSTMLYQRAIRRIYGEKTPDIIEGLKKNPQLAIPIVLKRLRSKEEEWREAQKNFNKIWREQNEKYYLKSLDHQGINFKQNDIKNLRSKALLNEIETLFDERHDQVENGAKGVGCLEGPHLFLEYRDRSVLDDAANLLIHHVKRQPGIQSQDKTRVKQLLRHTLPDLFHHPRQELSDDERDDVDDEDEGERIKREDGRRDEWQKKMEDKGGGPPLLNGDIGDGEYSAYPGMPDDPDEHYTFFMANTHWYSFLRLHHILCERLTKIYQYAQQLQREEDEDSNHRSPCTATALRLRPKSELEVCDYYPAFVDMVRNVLDGNMDSSAYEDTLREMFGIHAFTAFTIDKVISNAVRQLQNLVTDETSVQVTDHWLAAVKKNAGGGKCSTTHQRHLLEQQYQRTVESLLQDYTFKIYIYKIYSKMTIQLMDSESSESSEAGGRPDKWSGFIEQYVSTNRSELSNEVRRKLVDSPVPVFLIRTLSFYREKKERSEKKGSPMWDVEENLSSHFNYDSYRMNWCASGNKDDKMYKRGCLTNAKNSHRSVTVRLKSRFTNWHSNWLKRHVTDSATKQCSDWFLGRTEGCLPNRTRSVQDNDTKRPPYYLYNRYRVEKVEPS